MVKIKTKTKSGRMPKELFLINAISTQNRI